MSSIGEKIFLMTVGLLFMVSGLIDILQGNYSFTPIYYSQSSREISPPLALVFGTVLFFVSLRSILIKKKSDISSKK